MKDWLLIVVVLMIVGACLALVSAQTSAPFYIYENGVIVDTSVTISETVATGTITADKSSAQTPDTFLKIQQKSGYSPLVLMLAARTPNDAQLCAEAPRGQLVSCKSVEAVRIWLKERPVMQQRSK